MWDFIIAAYAAVLAKDSMGRRQRLTAVPVLLANMNEHKKHESLPDRILEKQKTYGQRTGESRRGLGQRMEPCPIEESCRAAG